MAIKRFPFLRVPGRGAGRSIPSGYLVGRVSTGRGPLEIVKPQQVGIATAKQVQSQFAQCGFRFNAGGLLLNNEDLGSGVWSHDVTFTNGLGSVVTAQTAPTSTAIFNIYALHAGVPTVIGTITFAAGSLTGMVNFPSVVVVAAGDAVRLNAPSPADATLASVTGTVYGFRS